MTDKIKTERSGHLLVITINRPEARNAFDRETGEGMSAAMDLLDEDDSLFVGVITGAGGTFCAGADLKAVARGERAGTEKRGGFGLFRKPANKPLIAAVEGYAVGGGLELCLSCDLIVAAHNAKLGLPEVRNGVVAVGGGLFRLPKRMPYHLAMELALTGDIRPVEFFHRHGLINRLVEPGSALDEAKKLAESLIVSSPLAMAASKAIMSRAHDWTDDDGWAQQMALCSKALQSEDRKEGLKAFAEKRKPNWTGR